MDQNAWIMFFAGIAVTSLLFGLGIVIYPRLKKERQRYPFEAEIEAALLPVIFDGVCAAYRLSEQSMDELAQRLKGADKKNIADSLYRLLPDKVRDYDLTLVKRVVSQERFEQLVQDGFDRFNRFYVEHRAHFDELFDEWKSENASVPAPVSLPTLADAVPATGQPVIVVPPSQPVTVSPPGQAPVVPASAPREPHFGGDFSQVRVHPNTNPTGVSPTAR